MKKLLKIIFLFLLVILSLIGCNKKSETKNTTNDETAAKIVETTKKVVERKKVLVYTSLSEGLMSDIKLACESAYDDVELEYFIGSNAEILDKINEEKADKISADVVLFGSQLDYENLKKDNILEKYSSNEINGILSNSIDNDGYYTYVNLLSSIGISWCYLPGVGLNSSSAPKTWEEMLDEKYKGKIVMVDPAVDPSTKLFISSMMQNSKYKEEYFKKLKENNVVVGNDTSIYNDLASGKYQVGFCSDKISSMLIEDASPLGFRYANNDNVFTALPIALVKNSVNVSQAKSFIDFMLSKDGQTILSSHGYMSIRKDVNENIANNMNIDYKDILENQDEYIKEFNTIFGR